VSAPEAEPRAFLRALFDAAVSSALPARVIPGRLPALPHGRAVVVGAGKAAAAMARAVEQEWAGPRAELSGLVVTRYGHAVPCAHIEVVEASHPTPDARGRRAAERIRALATELREDDLLICLISGGGSALLALPAPGIDMADKRTVNNALLRCGAPIEAINCVRKHLSAIKGGRLAEAAHPARVVTFLISDVPGDDPSVIASGPTVPDPSTYADAIAVLARFGVDVPPAVKARLLAGAGATTPSGVASAAPEETPKPGDPAFACDEVVMLATAADALRAAAAVARQAGVTPVVLGDAVEGEARTVGAAHAQLALRCAAGDGPASPPCVLLSGGETTVTVRGTGRGGRNAEYLLSAAITLGGNQRIYGLAGDTDGIDGTEDNAGALAGPHTLAAARRAGLDPDGALRANDAYGVFAALGDLVITGPTRTNVNDFRALYVV